MLQELEIKKEKPLVPEKEGVFPEVKPEQPFQQPQEIEKPASPPSPTPSKPKVKEEVPKIKALDQQNQVKVLCDLAFQKGLDQAIKTARSLNNAYVLDEFHDTLVDQLREQLIKKGKLKG